MFHCIDRGIPVQQPGFHIQQIFLWLKWAKGPFDTLAHPLHQAFGKLERVLASASARRIRRCPGEDCSRHFAVLKTGEFFQRAT